MDSVELGKLTFVPVGDASRPGRRSRLVSTSSRQTPHGLWVERNRALFTSPIRRVL